MADLAVTHAFVDATPAEAAEVNTNFTDVEQWVNTNAIRKDGSVALTALLAGPSTDPTANNHLVRKKYVDDRVPTCVPISIPATTAAPGGSTIGTVTITDPGYDIDIWGVAVAITQPNVAADLNNIWELSVADGGVQKAAFRIPIVAGQQSLACPVKRFTHTTGSNAVITVVAARAAGSQINLGILLSAQSTWGEVWWRRH